tara:strand:+ start:55 stop:495 length:441 start_codon:yes stop_codon:yes gene_type:complete
MVGFKKFFRSIFKTKIVFLSFLLIFTLAENVSAGILNLNCYVKSHYKNDNSETWYNSNYQYQLEINQRTKKIVFISEDLYEFDFTIINQTKNQIIAILDMIYPNQEGIVVTAITLDLNSKTITGVNTMNETVGISFDNFHGKCFQK